MASRCSSGHLANNGGDRRSYIIKPHAGDVPISLCKRVQRDETWNKVKTPNDRQYRWDAQSTYIRKPTFFEALSRQPPEIPPTQSARVLAFLGIRSPRTTSLLPGAFLRRVPRENGSWNMAFQLPTSTRTGPDEEITR